MADNTQVATLNKGLWLLIIALLYVIGVCTFLMLTQTPDKLYKNLSEEREGYSSFSVGADEWAWEQARYSGIFSPLVRELAFGIARTGETSARTELDFSDRTDLIVELLPIYALQLDYRFFYFVALAPIVFIIALCLVLDAFFVRKKNNYRNSFSSPLRHTVGGKLIGMPMAYLLLITVFLPVNLSIHILLAFTALKMFGWWMWLVNLPKRM